MLQLATPPALEQPVALPMAMAQQRLWLIDQLEPGHSAYSVPVIIRLQGSLDVRALAQALNQIIERHEILRTTFDMIDGQAIQIIAPQLLLSMPVVELAHRSADDCDRQIKQHINAMMRQPFDLRTGPLIRAGLLQLDADEHVFMLVMHHIICDGWSNRVMMSELSQLYAAAVADQPSPLPDLPIQYADYAQWQHDWLTGETLDHLTRHWKAKLHDAPALDLPLDHHRPGMLSTAGSTVHIVIPNAIRDSLQRLAREQQASMFMVLLSAFKVLLARYTGQMDVVIGTPIAGRTRSELDPLIGFFANMLVLRTDLAGDPSFIDLVSRVRAVALDAYDHQDLPFDKLVEELRPRRDRSIHPLFQVAFMHGDEPMALPHLPGLQATSIPVQSCISKFDMMLATSNQPDGLHCHLEYSTDLFEAATITTMLQHLRVLLESIVANPQQSISRLTLLSNQERHAVLHGFNHTSTDYPRDSTIHELFAEQAKQSPHAIAIIDGDLKLSYRRLAQRADAIASSLVRCGAKPGDRIAICMNRSANLIASLLGILQIGAAYVPLDPQYPASRLQFMLDDTKARLVIHDDALPDELMMQMKGSDEAPPFIEIESLLKTEPQPTPEILVSAQDLAYLIFTSGSTGVPKAVAVPHRGVVRLVKNTQYATMGFDERVLLLAPVSFDASTFEIWAPLLNGGICIIHPHRVPQLDLLEQTIKDKCITTMWLTSALFNAVIDQRPSVLESVKTLLIGGEALSPEHVRHAYAMLPSIQIINGYGPTENTTFTCTHPIPRDLPATVTSVPIGKPIANTRVYILDDNLQPMPIGVPGELHIGGDGLARGYWNRPQLTQEKFIRDPFTYEPTARLYRSGDRCRWRADGTIEFMGRLDDQVKLRGFRIELGEISQALTSHPDVLQCVVVVDEQGSDRRLVAYIVPGSRTPTHDELTAHLRRLLPAYMLPGAFMVIDAIPLTPAGKVDRQALPAPVYVKTIADDAANEPLGEIERELVSLWSKMLAVDHVGIHDNFFDLGGHSLAAVSMFDQISRQFGKSLPLATLFDHPTIAELSPLLRDESEIPKAPLIVPLKSTGHRPPFFCVHGIGGDLLFLKALVEDMPQDQPFYGIRAMGTDERENIETDIATMASTYIKAMREIQPQGPYAIGGFSSGGTIAYEMAQQLVGLGEVVSLLAVFDHAPFNLGKRMPLWHPVSLARWCRNLPFYLMDDLLRPTRKTRALSRITGKFRVWRGKVKERVGFTKPAEQQQPQLDFQAMFGVTTLSNHRKQFLQTHYDALRNYHPKPYAGCVTVFRARTRPLFHMDLPEVRWRLIAGKVDVHVIPGSHEGIFHHPHVQRVASKLAACLCEAFESE